MSTYEDKNVFSFLFAPFQQ